MTLLEGPLTVNRFRRSRGRKLARLIADYAERLGRPVRVLDVGGRSEYWDQIDTDHISHITVMNNDDTEMHSDRGIFSPVIGDACDMRDVDDQSFDLVHSNSVIEHVGSWQNMRAMAREVRRVGRAGWVQTPAWEFPVEPHFRLPLVHYFNTPIRARMISLSPAYRRQCYDALRAHAERINLLSGREMRMLFPDAEIWHERLLLTKSYVAHWGL